MVLTGQSSNKRTHCDAQAREGIEDADASIRLLAVQSQLGLADKGPLPAQTLAAAALQVICSPPFQRNLQASQLFLRAPARITFQHSAVFSSVNHCAEDGQHAPTDAAIAAQASRAPQVDSSAAETQHSSFGPGPSHAAAVLLVFRILAVAGQQLNGSAR